MTIPQLMKRRRWRGPIPYRQVRCALCYRRFWPWQQQVRGANYFRHPWMMVHLRCAAEHYPYAVQDIERAS